VALISRLRRRLLSVSLSVLYRPSLPVRKMSTIRSPTPSAGLRSPFTLSPNLPPLPDVPGTDPERCVLDAFRIAIAKHVADALPPLTVEQVYAGVDYGKKGRDFTIALPRFRLPGKVDDIAKKVLEKVSSRI